MEDELQNAKEHLKGGLMLGLESTSNRMSNLAREEIYFQRHYAYDEILARVEEVTAESVRALAEQIFQTDAPCLTLTGNVEGLKVAPEDLQT
jgi:predicted Zn-dependent peptidase